MLSDGVVSKRWVSAVAALVVVLMPE